MSESELNVFLSVCLNFKKKSLLYNKHLVVWNYYQKPTFSPVHGNLFWSVQALDFQKLVVKKVKKSNIDLFFGAWDHAPTHS